MIVAGTECVMLEGGKRDKRDRRDSENCGGCGVDVIVLLYI